ncbi:hypothetical protein BV22DRAFT_630343 [Leucogyrophana mollusca]|uniref:Uncharacterized protein n=1 Tax=Leucogyrophana mollusca TaxID=85980 RepID=A0ACB8BAW3_9AGAM|nr:hypothetical protein BV22DRAFT_630343 [Leucogyrophana mollusca]
MSDNSVVAPWIPSIIGTMLGLGMYGISLGQYAFYLHAFPVDQRALKILVALVLVMDTLSTYGVVYYHWAVLVSCHHNASLACLSFLPWQVFMAEVLGYTITVLVQSFYAHRVWIISGHNRWITTAVYVTALAQFVFGMMCFENAIRTRDVTVMYTSLDTGGTGAAISALCDILITSSIFFYLRPQRTGVRRREPTIQRLVHVFVHMGLFTCLVSLITFALYCMRGQEYFVGATGSALCKFYVNSMLAVLNARKFIQERNNTMKTIELSTLFTSHPSTSEASSSVYPG